MTPRNQLSAGEYRLCVNDRQQRLALHMVKVASGRPYEFGGIGDHGYTAAHYERLCLATIAKLQHAGIIVITKVQREFLHSVIDDALTNPELYGGIGSQRDLFVDMVKQMQVGLPPRGSGTY